MLSLRFFSLLKIHTEIIKVTKVYLIKFGGLHYGAILSKSLKDQKLFSSLQSRAWGEFRMYGAMGANTWPNIFLVLPTALGGVIWGGMWISVKLDGARGVWYLLLRVFRLPGFNVWGGGGVWALGYVTAQIWDLPNISLFANDLDNTFHFTCG